MMFPFRLTHAQLVEIAYKWLVANGGVGVAFKELKSMSSEIPDVIGFNSSDSILIECKASRADFLRDKRKKHRVNGAKGMGNWRFVFCLKGLVKVEELPEKWGLIYVDENGKAKIEYDCRYKKIKVSSDFYRCGFYEQRMRAEENYFEVDTSSERNIMYTALRRLFIKGHVKCIYDKQYNSLTNRQILNFEA